MSVQSIAVHITAVSWPMYRSVCFNWQHHFRTGEFCWNMVFLRVPTCRCWWQLVHSH